MDSNRTCGECIACCIVPEVRGEDFVKPSLATCPYINPETKINRCLLQRTGKKPLMCTSFRCAWLRGFGSGNHRPDKVGCMVSLNTIGGSTWIVVMNLKPTAHLTTGKQLITDIASRIDFPVIVVEHDHLKGGKGDYVIIKQSHEPRSTKIRGDFIVRYTDDMNIYKLIISSF
jgi:hypothetical protein